MNSQNAFDRVANAAAAIYSEIKAFFASPIFFILLGCAFLFIAAKLMIEDTTHPSFVFLLAILGISIVLYGTGTQGVGTAEPKDFPIKVAVAGGAGVLAAVFGFGVAWQGQNIQNVFKPARQYGLIVLETDAKSKLFDLTTFTVSAKAKDGRELHLLSRAGSVEILVPGTSFTANVTACVSVKTRDDKPMTPNPNCPVVTWEQDADAVYGHVGKGILLLTPVAAQVDEQNRPAQGYQFTPQ